MLLIVLALFWVAVLIPIGIRHFRENGTERSIESFHAEHDVLSRQEYSVQPSHRLEFEDEDYEDEVQSRPRLTVVHEDDTYRSLETRSSWDEWSEDYDYDDERPTQSRYDEKNRYAAAYSSVPRESDTQRYDDQYPIRASMKVRRTRIFIGLLASAVLFTMFTLLVSSSLVEDVALLLWLGFAGFVAAALLSVSQGYLHESSLPLRRIYSRGMATIAPLRPEIYEDDDSEFYDGDDDGQWSRESSSRYALG
jgi:hypothetical protein